MQTLTFNRKCRDTVFPLISASPLISVALLHAALIKNIAIFHHNLNQEAYRSSIQPKEQWKYCQLLVFSYLLVCCK